MKKQDHREALNYLRKSRVLGLAKVRTGTKPELSPPSSQMSLFHVISGSIVFGILGLLAGTVFYTLFPHCQAVFTHSHNMSAFDKAGDIGKIRFIPLKRTWTHAGHRFSV